ncbi:lytic transglycosylase domain-containing protein [uncultured Alsobacter sp.]|uniref:lytic transglycosylase domain-containing protein n=1 Tax=uncultured Alsobacter sp. TaxID=1748258 RepID=UPI0025D24926|nr:transglycosylase SLT domain-containing protein [uncultured Alsobacter sp.]
MKKTVTVAGLVASLVAGSAAARAEGGGEQINWHLASVQPTASAPAEPATTGSIAPAAKSGDAKSAAHKSDAAKAEHGKASPSKSASADPEAAKPEDATASDKAVKASGALSFVAGERGAYRDLIARHAAANGVPFALADAVVRIESRYNPTVRHGGAVGLMQIKPQTARGLGYSGGAQGLLHPETNLRWGMLYLAQAYRMSKGETCATVMRYQSGHGATRMNGANRVYCAKARTIMASLR